MVVKHSSPSKKHAAPPRKAAAAKTAKGKKASSALRSKKKGAEQEVVLEEEGAAKKSGRPEDEVVTYEEQDFELREIPAQGNKVLIGPPWLTRFERARITGARSLQLALGAPSLIKVPPGVTSSIMLAVAEVEHKALPISIRRILPNGVYQDIPTDWMK